MTGAGPAFQVRIWGEMRLLEDGKVVGGGKTHYDVRAHDQRPPDRGG